MPKVFKLYNKELFSKDESPDLNLSVDTVFSFRIFRPSILKLGLDSSERFKRLLWFIITRGRMNIFYIMKGNQVAHYSFITPKNFRFPFMKEKDLQIGPCFTYPEFRGQGLYGQALKLIPLLFIKQANIFWIYTTSNNTISQHVIEKAGYDMKWMIKSSGLFKILKRI